jgi:hypothetical protein
VKAKEMSTTLDGRRLFDEQQIEIEVGSLEKDSIERKMAGLDGMLSIDMGSRGRTIKQSGSLQAKSLMKMNDRIGAISAYIDGKTHKLVTNNGMEFDNLRVDTFRASRERPSGAGLCCDYEIVYRQLIA